MMLSCDDSHLAKGCNPLQDASRDSWMLVDCLPLLRTQLAFLVEDRIRYPQLADVVQQGSSANQLRAISGQSHRPCDPKGGVRNPLRVTVSKVRLGIDHIRECLADTINLIRFQLMPPARIKVENCLSRILLGVSRGAIVPQSPATVQGTSHADKLRIEPGAAALFESVDRALHPISRRGEVQMLCRGADTGQQRNLLSLKTVRITASIPALFYAAHGVRRNLIHAEFTENGGSTIIAEAAQRRDVLMMSNSAPDKSSGSAQISS